MINLRSVQLAGTVVMACLAAVLGGNFAFAQESGGHVIPSCTETPFVSQCNYTGLAQQIGIGMMIALIVFASALGAFSRRKDEITSAAEDQIVNPAG